MRKTKPDPLEGQGRILCCQVCGHTWTSMDPFEIERTITQPENARCCCCVYLEMTRRYANAQGRSLRKAVGAFLKGSAKRLGIRVGKLWKGVSSD